MFVFISSRKLFLSKVQLFIFRITKGQTISYTTLHPIQTHLIFVQCGSKSSLHIDVVRRPRSMTAIIITEEVPLLKWPSRVPFFFFLCHLNSADPKSCLQVFEFSHYVDNASGREGGFWAMTFRWFDKKCFEDSQLRKQERRRVVGRGRGGPRRSLSVAQTCWLFFHKSDDISI